MHPMADIIINTRFDGPSQHGSFRHHLWMRHRPWVIARSLLCVAGVVVGAYLIEPGTEAGIFGSMLVVVGTLGFMRPMIWQMWQERGLRKHPAYETDITFRFNRDGVKIQGAIGDAELGWGDLYQVAPTKKGLLLYQDKKQYMWIPSADISAEQMQRVVAFKG